MTPTETVLLVRYVRACCPHQAMDEYTPDAWHDLLGDLPLADCKLAVQVVAKRQPFIAPAEIRAEVRRVRNERIAHSVIPAPDPELDPPAHRAALAESVRRAADGELPAGPEPLAITGGPKRERRHGQPAALAELLTETRASLAAGRRHVDGETGDRS
jgi:hypothetical protein